MNKRITKKVVKSVLASKPWRVWKEPGARNFHKKVVKNTFISIIDHHGYYELGMWRGENRGSFKMWLTVTDSDQVINFSKMNDLANFAKGKIR